MSVTSFTVLIFFFAAVLAGAVGAGPVVDAVAGTVDGPGNETAWTITARSLEPIPKAAGLEVHRRILQSLDPRAAYNPNRQACLGPCPARGDGFTPVSHCNRKYYNRGC